METILVIPDTHVPFHDKRAWNLYLKVQNSLKPDRVVLVGDFMDCFSVSSHSKDPRRQMKLVDEVAATNDELDKVTARKDVVFLEGNHENRLFRYLSDKAPELFGVADTKSLLRIKDRGWRFAPYRSSVKIGKVTYTHDLGRAGENALYQTLKDFGGNIVFGHTHRGGVVYQGEAKGSSHFGLNVGWLGSFQDVDYMHQARAKRLWQHGFGLVRTEKNGRSHAQFIAIVGGKAVVDGKEYR